MTVCKALGGFASSKINVTLVVILCESGCGVNCADIKLLMFCVIQLFM